MATLKDTIASGALVVFEMPEWETRQPKRMLYVTPELIFFADETKILHDPSCGIGGRTIFEHLDQFFCSFICDEHFHYGDIKRMRPNVKGVWKMHPNKLRVYGWCPAKNAFVAVTAALEQDTKDDKKLNDKKRDEVFGFAKKHKIDHTMHHGDYNELFPHPSQP